MQFIIAWLTDEFVVADVHVPYWMLLFVIVFVLIVIGAANMPSGGRR